ncbi:hypothetical protein GCM10025862_22500 [Arsenicicoccus piscis]|uniref:MFS transporter n=1 Tax=Arsenicicoccus piscis TaxID=673954 RepID=A0ABQ6HP40_9MICO|nr:hypothetical protein [Arsenicicoccus piscis]GMA20229.1 hypothetical protein GCM10025862_22500 [Arsenicicoccus piscis]
MRRWVWVIVVAFGILNAVSAGGWLVLGPVVAKATAGFGERGWGLALSVESVGLLVGTVLLLRLRLRRPLLAGMIAVAGVALPILALGGGLTAPWVATAALFAGVGSAIFGVAWDTALQQHVPQAALSRVYSYDMLGSFVAMPVGQLAWGLIASAVDPHRLMVVSGVVYLIVALGTLTIRSVRTLPDQA